MLFFFFLGVSCLERTQLVLSFALIPFPITFPCSIRSSGCLIPPFPSFALTSAHRRKYLYASPPHEGPPLSDPVENLPFFDFQNLHSEGFDTTPWTSSSLLFLNRLYYMFLQGLNPQSSQSQTRASLTPYPMIHPPSYLSFFSDFSARLLLPIFFFVSPPFALTIPHTP